MKTMREGIKILFSKEFWVDFFDYYSSDNIAKRLNLFTKRLEKFRK